MESLGHPTGITIEQMLVWKIFSLRHSARFSSCHICTAGDDHQALIWDIQQMPRAIEDPILAYTAAEGEVNQIQWGATQPDWIAICYNKACEILRV